MTFIFHPLAYCEWKGAISSEQFQVEIAEIEKCRVKRVKRAAGRKREVYELKVVQ